MTQIGAEPKAGVGFKTSREEVVQMLGHGLHCVWDATEIPEDRARKGAITCCDECKRQYANYRRRVRSRAKCRLCGRGRRQNAKLDPVLMEHTGVYGRLEPHV